MSKAKPSSRRRARQAALQVLYASALASRRKLPEVDTDLRFESAAQNFELPEGARPFAKELVSGVTARKAEIDGLIEEHSTDWRIGRMATVDVSILRLACYELLSSDTPSAVVIDEAKDLASRFAADEAQSFVHGVLAAISRKLRGASE